MSVTPPISPRNRFSNSSQLLELEEEDPRWQLVERIISSPSFAKSERLSSFLICVCQLVQTGQADAINEQHIGAAVFGRKPDYDPAIDSIVRSHASRLRHRLVQYFAEEGAGEDLVLTIPKGGYVPVFELRPMSTDKPLAIKASAYPAIARQINGEDDPHSEVSALSNARPIVFAQEVYKDRKTLIAILIAGLVATSLLAATAMGGLILERRRSTAGAAIVSETVPFFWANLFNPRQNTTVVIADSGLVMLQNLTKRRVTLESYMSGDYLKDLPPTAYPAQQTLSFGIRRYTSIVDLTIQNRLFRMPGIDLERTQFRYSRDLRMGDVKEGNLMLLGTYESTPWVQLFEPSMNFYFENDLSKGVFSIINRNPQTGESARYDSFTNDPNHTVYGVVAYRPTLSGSGKVLILEGQSMAGTETASDFVFDDGYFLPFLRSIRRADGSIPYFELVLRSQSIRVEASSLETVAYRLEDR